jgi:hypothetical protein
MLARWSYVHSLTRSLAACVRVRVPQLHSIFLGLHPYASLRLHLHQLNSDAPTSTTHLTLVSTYHYITIAELLASRVEGCHASIASVVIVVIMPSADTLWRWCTRRHTLDRVI